MRVSKEMMEEIRNRNDIVELIGSYVNLKRAGSNMQGLCPFHSEKTPSFIVFPATQSFRCFGCGAGGDVFEFVKKSENLDFYGALEFLAKRAGITLVSEEKEEKGVGRRRVCDMNLAAAKYFRACLFDPQKGSVGMNYLTGKRALSPAVIKHFGLGYAPDGFGGLTDHMRKLGFTEEELITGFLCGKSKKTGRAYDYFRNRVIFPIINTSGDIIAFGGRVMDDSTPKYLNSSDTPAFKKSKNLFALNYAKNYCSERMILCEGYMDVIALHAAGFENAVATLGTALTGEQARLMAKHTKQVIICYDSDKAGQAATVKAVRLLSEVGLEVKILRMEGAKDPDEYIRKFGADAFRRLVEKSRTGFEYKLESVISKYNIEAVDEKVKAAAEMTDYLAQVLSDVERDVYITSAAKALSLSPEALKNDVKNLRKKKIGVSRAQQVKEAKNAAMGIGDRINTDGIKNIRARSAEEAVLGLLLLYDEYRDAVVRERIALNGADFVSDFHRTAFEKIIELQREDQYDYSLLGQFFNPDEMGRLMGLEQNRRMLTENGKTVFEECVKALKKESSLTENNDGENSKINEIQRLLAQKRNGNQ